MDANRKNISEITMISALSAPLLIFAALAWEIVLSDRLPRPLHQAAFALFLSGMIAGIMGLLGVLFGWVMIWTAIEELVVQADERQAREEQKKEQ